MRRAGAGQDGPHGADRRVTRGVRGVGSIPQRELQTMWLRGEAAHRAHGVLRALTLSCRGTLRLPHMSESVAYVPGMPRAIAVDQSGIHVALGTWNGQNTTLTITGTEQAVMYASDGVPEALTADACSVAVNALESCAVSEDCSSFESSSAGIAYGDMRDIEILFHQTTGFNAENFATVCVTSCELGLTPSRKLIEEAICAGASASQWTRTDLGWMTRWAGGAELTNSTN